MAKTLSNMPELGMIAQNFSLENIDGSHVSLSDYMHERPLLLMFICNHCPYVIHVMEKLVEIAKNFQKQGVDVIAINSNDVSAYPEDSPDNMKLFSKHHGLTFPYLFDKTQEVARTYSAACTPDFFLFDSHKKLFYRGQMDASRPGNQEANDGADLKNAINLILSNEQPPEDQKPSMGCNIKWK